MRLPGPDAVGAALRSRPARLLQVGVTLALLCWILASLDGRAWRAIGSIGPVALGGAVILFSSAQIFGGLRLSLLLPERSLWREALAATWIGYFWGNFLPSTVGGDVVRGFRLTRAGVKLPTVAGALLLDRLLNFCAVVLVLMATALPLSAGPARHIASAIAMPAAIAAACGIGLVLWLARSSERVRTAARMALEPLRLVSRSPARLCGVVLMSLLSLGVAIAAEWLLARRLGIAIGIAELANIICLVTLLVLLPVSLNGLGLQEASFVVFLTRAGAPIELALSFSLLARVLIVGAGGIGGLVTIADRLTAGRRLRSP